MEQEPWRTILIAVYIIAWLGAFVFPIYYHFTAAWWRTPMGRHLMGYTSVVALLLTNSLLRLFFPEMTGRLVISRVLVFAMAFIMWWRVVAYVREQRLAHRTKKKADKEGSEVEDGTKP